MNTAIDRNFDGKLSVENRYDYLNLNTCRFIWQQVKFPSVTDASNTTTRILKQGEVQGSDVAAMEWEWWISRLLFFPKRMLFS